MNPLEYPERILERIELKGFIIDEWGLYKGEIFIILKKGRRKFAFWNGRKIPIQKFRRWLKWKKQK